MDTPSDDAPDDPPSGLPGATGPDPRARPIAPARRSAVVAALGALAAGLAPGLEWYRIEVDVGPVPQWIATTGWDRSGLGVRSAHIIGGARPGPGWDIDPGWIVAGIPDGVVASLLAAVVLAAAARLVLTGRATRPAAGVVAGLGVLGLAWVAVSWWSIRRSEAAHENSLIAVLGLPESHIRDAYTGATGPGLLLSAVGFAVVAMAGLVALRSVTRGPGAAP